MSTATKMVNEYTPEELLTYETEQLMKPWRKRECIYCRGTGKRVHGYRAKSLLRCAECNGSGKGPRGWVAYEDEPVTIVNPRAIRTLTGGSPNEPTMYIDVNGTYDGNKQRE